MRRVHLPDVKYNSQQGLYYRLNKNTYTGKMCYLRDFIALFYNEIDK